ncbi:polysaccharide deacetylase family protein [Xylella taiwanensis]|uniref:Acetylxylan esterase n=2 Tax=Xylella taiwanensis TaxID=1444770 RepID=Z9JN84_9GAMM|nr:acetyl xylan esterase [Xylella taiwanensis]EWS79212.1 acetylxylan esterase [Xylella taiwanensis]NBI37317.1 polysaccharide deacetylase family protein [Xylella taiwanensis]QKD98222.1 polysaccharide deacetylase family protein [Xylella taiwanensis]
MIAKEIPHYTVMPARPWIGWFVLSHLTAAVLWWCLGWHWGLPVLLISQAYFLLAVFLPRSRLYAPVVVQLDSTAPVVWLTIDDGPSDDTAPMLDLLDRHDARATFFLVGERAARQPALVREILRRGHAIGNHSHTHPYAWFWALGPRHMATEIGMAQHTLTEIIGTPPRWYRSVVGMTNPWVAAPLCRHGLERIAWSARGFDGTKCEPDDVVARIVRDLRPGAIVLLHEGIAHGHNCTILSRVLEALDARGLKARNPN